MRYYNFFEERCTEEKKYWEVYFPAKQEKRSLYLNKDNNIWLKRRNKLPLEERIKPYRWLGIGNWLRNDVEKKLRYLDLHFLDPLTGILNQEYINVFPHKRREKSIMLYVNNECVDKVNKEISMKAGDMVLHAAASVLREIKEVVARFYYNGLYFIVFGAQYGSIIEAKMKLARTTIFLSDGHQIKGIGLQLRDIKDCSYSYPLVRIWGGVVKTEILKTAPITKRVKWANVFVCSKFHNRVEGKFLDLIWNEQSYAGKNNE